MSLNESSATALVRFTGLGIICFNPERQQSEIAVIRDNKHSLTVKIQQPVFQEGSGTDTITYQDIAVYQDLPKSGVKIEIRAQGKPAIDGYEIYKPGTFDRLDSPDANDFRWIVNMNTLHDDTTVNPASAERFPVTGLYIGNGLFYTQKLDREMCFEKVATDASGATRELFGNVGETIGVKIEGEEVNFTIRIGDKEETHSLKRVAGLPFRIEIKNMDYSDNPVYSDMADYYRYLSGPKDTQIDFARIVDDAGGETAKAGAVNQVEFCHPISTDDPITIDGFFPNP